MNLIMLEDEIKEVFGNGGLVQKFKDLDYYGRLYLVRDIKVFLDNNVVDYGTLAKFATEFYADDGIEDSVKYFMTKCACYCCTASHSLWARFVNSDKEIAKKVCAIVGKGFDEKNFDGDTDELSHYRKIMSIRLGDVDDEEKFRTILHGRICLNKSSLESPVVNDPFIWYWLNTNTPWKIFKENTTCEQAIYDAKALYDCITSDEADLNILVYNSLGAILWCDEIPKCARFYLYKLIQHGINAGWIMKNREFFKKLIDKPIFLTLEHTFAHANERARQGKGLTERELEDMYWQFCLMNSLSDSSPTLIDFGRTVERNVDYDLFLQYLNG